MTVHTPTANLASHTHLHDIHSIVDGDAVNHFHKNLDHVLPPVVVVIVQHDLVDWGLLSNPLSAAGGQILIEIPTNYLLACINMAGCQEVRLRLGDTPLWQAPANTIAAMSVLRPAQ
jgi:hypothetical protein